MSHHFISQGIHTHARALGRVLPSRLGWSVIWRKLSHGLNQGAVWRNAIVIAAAVTLGVLADQWSSSRALAEWQKDNPVTDVFVERILRSQGFSPCLEPKLSHTLLKSFLRDHAYPVAATFAFDQSQRKHLLWFPERSSVPHLFSLQCEVPVKSRKKGPKKSPNPSTPPPQFLTLSPTTAKTALTWPQIQALINELSKAPPPQKSTLSRRIMKISPYEISY